jgi:hypothetical protein
MKKFILDLSAYKVGGEDFPIRGELAGLLRIPGVYKDGVETCDGVILARSIVKEEKDCLEINETELALIKKVMNQLIAREHKPQLGQIALGGPRYEELIMRVFRLKEKE